MNTAAARLYDGSGLSLGDRLTAQGIVSVITTCGSQPYGFWFRNSLPMAGVSGTLSDRMRTGPAHGNAQAKTGTLRDASALSGYVTARERAHDRVLDHREPRPRPEHHAARGLQDRDRAAPGRRRDHRP